MLACSAHIKRLNANSIPDSHPLFSVVYDEAEHSIELLGGIFAKYLIEV